MQSFAQLDDLAKAQNGDYEARSRLIEKNYGLILKLSRTYGRSLGDDAQSVAILGLNNGIDQFDPSSGISFSGFLAGSIINALREESRKERLAQISRSRKTGEGFRALASAEDLATAELGRRPYFHEIAHVAGFSHEAAATILRKAQLPYSLDIEFGSALDGIHTALDYLEDPLLYDPDHSIGREQQIEKIIELFPTLTEREQYVLRSLYRDPKIPNNEIAETLGVSLTRVDQIRVKALGKIREVLANDPQGAYHPSSWAQTIGVGGELSIKRFRSILWLADLIEIPEVDRIETGIKRCADVLGLSKESLRSLVSGEQHIPPDLVFKLIRNLFKNYNPDLDKAIEMLKQFAHPGCYNWQSLKPSIKRRKALSDFSLAHEAYKLDSRKVARIMGIFSNRFQRILFGHDHFEKFELSRLDRLAWHVGKEKFPGSEVFLRPQEIRPDSFSIR